MSDGFGIDELEARIDAYRDTGVVFEIDKLNKEAQEVLKYMSKMWDAIVKGDKPTQKELNELKKATLLFYQSSQASTKDTRTYLNQWFQQLALRIDKLEKNRFMHSFNANTSNQMNQGILNPNKKGAENNVLAQQLKAGFLSPLVKSVDSFADKLMSFLGMDRDSRKTRMRQFREDLVEGLSKSKFFGGALMDLLKLGVLFIASWAKDKGLLGKVLAVTLVAAIPVIATAIGKAVVGAFVTGITKVASLIGSLFFAPIRWLGRTLFTWMGRLLGAIWASKALGGLRGGLAALGIGSVSKGAVSKAGAALAPGLMGFEGAMIASAEKELAKNTATGLGKVVAKTAAKSGARALVGGGISNPVGIALTVWAIFDIIKAIWDWWKGREQDKSNSSKGFHLFGGKKDETNRNNLNTNYVYDQKGNGSATLAGRKITSGFGYRDDPFGNGKEYHSGIDLAYNRGEAVNALMGGRVISSQWQDGFGNTVRVQDKNGKIHVYGHLDSLGVKAGQEVTRGQYLGAAGSTGRSKGPHLHYGVANDTSWDKYSYIDPIAYLRAYEPDALKGKEKKGLKYKDKEIQKIAEYLDSQGKDKGWFNSKKNAYDELEKKYREEYANNLAGIDPNKPNKDTEKAKIKLKALDSDLAKEYAKKRIAEDVKMAKEEAVANATSIAINTAANEQKEEITDLTDSATEQARAQWGRLNKDFKEDALRREKSPTIIPPDNQPIIDFSGTETCSKVLQNTINAQQQSFKQQ